MYESLRSQIMKGLIDWVDFHFGAELTGYAVYISWDGTILDIDKEEITLKYPFKFFNNVVDGSHISKLILHLKMAIKFITNFLFSSHFIAF